MLLVRGTLRMGFTNYLSVFSPSYSGRQSAGNGNHFGRYKKQIGSEMSRDRKAKCKFPLSSFRFDLLFFHSCSLKSGTFFI